MEKKSKHPEIDSATNSPYIVKDCDDIIDASGNPIAAEPVVYLCRCGGSKQKPYCDGTHNVIGFKNETASDGQPDRVLNYQGAEITIHDNRKVCSKDGSCVRLLPAVFRKNATRWIHPDAAPVKDIISTIQKCPSGALSYTLNGKKYDSLNREPRIAAAKNGPLEVTGSIALNDDHGRKPCAKEHYTLCRCGSSKNQPFCDGTHIEIEFKDPE